MPCDFDSGPPWTDPTAATWRAYADWLSEQPGRERDWMRALRYALGLTRRPKLVLMGLCVEEDLIGTIRLTSWHLRPVRPGCRYIGQYLQPRWCTLRYAIQSQRKDPPNLGMVAVEKGAYLSSPLDFPSLLSDPQHLWLCKRFLQKAAETVRTPELRDGVPHIWQPRGPHCQVLEPVSWDT